MTVLEIGPAAVVRWRPNRQSGGKGREEPDKTSDSAAMVSVALAGIDDTTVLLRERPVAVADLWRRIIASSLETPCESLTVVHPSWWAQHRVTRILDAAGTVAADVLALSRSAAITAHDPATVIEIADDVVAISSPDGPPRVLTRPADPGDVARSVEKHSGTKVLIDAPAGVRDGVEYARAVRATLCRRGVSAQLGVVHQPTAPVVQPTAVVAPSRRRRRPLLAATAVALVLCAMGVSQARIHPPSPALDAVAAVEGRITVRLPAHWVVRRITAGPGSRRIQASSPTEPDLALHVTQSYSPGETLDRTADMLRQAVGKQPSGVFVDFNPADRRAGRSAVTYREVRVGRDIRWAVVVDGSTRISVGCQSIPGREDAVAVPCEQAIESAHEMTGTNSGM